MCTRFYIDKENKELTEIGAAACQSPLAKRFMTSFGRPILTDGEIRPTDIVPVIAPNKKGRRAVFPMRWGFTLPKSSQPLVNARVETASSKPTFIEAWQRHRCIIPASWYYEWEHYTTPDGKQRTGDKYLIQPANASITWLCGLYRFEDGFPVFTILTQDAVGEQARIHDRMPVILPEGMTNEWIKIDADPDDILSHALTDMIMEKTT